MAFPAGRPIARFRRSFPAVTTTVTVVAMAVAITRAPGIS